MSHLKTVQRIYAAFGRGDVPGILEHLAADVEWDYGIAPTDVPWLQPRRGHAAVREFFQALQALEIRTFQPKTFLERDDVVVVLLDVALTIRETGRRIAEEDEVHIWQFDAAGKVYRFTHKLDTHQHVAAARGALAHEM